MRALHFVTAVVVVAFTAGAASESLSQDGAAGSQGVSAGLPIRLGGSVTIRQDFTSLEDQTDLLLDDNSIDGLRGRIRLWAEHRDPKAFVGGGLRVSAGQTTNPASPFVRLGDAFRPLSIGFDQFYLSVRPFKNRERAVLTFGKMPQPFWRGDRGTVRAELIWDDDISPVGATLQNNLYENADKDRPVRLDNLLGYFTLQETTNARFEGITGTTYLIADQLKLKVDRVSAAVSFYSYENLNAGLRSPNFTPGQGGFVVPGTDAFLLRSGFQATNNHINLGPGANAFLEDHFRILDFLGQVSVPVSLGLPGKPEAFVLGQYTRNLEVPLDKSGWGVTLGLSGGAWEGSWANPFNIHATYRDVDADAALGVFADSDLGAGTNFKGFEISGNYRLARNLLFTVFYFDFDGAPRKDSSVQRLFFDLTWDF